MKKIRVIELFAGYGSQHLALKRLKRDYPEFEYEVVAFCEIDGNAIKAYHALHGDNIPNLGDITKVNPSDVPDCDLMTWSFPCQSISSAGLQHGLAEGSGTRSSLCWNAMRIFEAKRPKYLLMENVSALVSDKFIGDFNLLQSSLQKIGYTNFAQLMNAKDYGVPQNRLRIFMVSILDCPRAYYFPKPFKLQRRLKDVLEQNVAERYYLKEEQVEKLMIKTEKEQQAGHGYKFEPLTGDEDYGRCVTTNSGGRMTDNFISEPEIQQIGNLHNNEGNPQSGRVYSSDGVSPTVDASAPEHNRRVLIAEPQDNVMLGWTRSNTGKGDPTYHPVSVANCVTAAKRDNTQNYILEPTIAAMRGRDKDNPNDRGKSTDNYAQRLEPKPDGTSNTITSVAKDNLLIIPQATKEGYAVVPEGGVFDASYPDSKTRRGRVQEGGTVSPTIMASQNELLRYEGKAQVMQIGNLIDDTDRDFKNPQTGRVYSSDGLSPTINTCQGGQREPKIMTGIRIRRLTERELYRLMDVSEPDIDTLLNAGISNTQLAKLAGNSVVCACYYHIFRKLFIDTNANVNEQLQLF